METNTFGSGDKHIFALEINTSLLEMDVLNLRSNYSHTHTASYRQLSNQSYFEMITPTLVLTFENGKYHALVLTSEYATPASYVYAIAFSTGIIGLQLD